MDKTAVGLEKLGHTVWIVAHPNSRFVKSASSQLKLVVRKLGMDYNPLTIRFLVQFIKTHQIDLLVTNIEKEVIVGGIAARICGIPNIRRVGREDDFNEKFKVKWHHRLLVDHCIVPCDQVRDNSIKRSPWLCPEQFTTIYNGRNVKRFSNDEIRMQRKAWGFYGGDELIIGVTTQLAKVKGLDHLIHVFHQILRHYPDAYLVITGEGKDQPVFEKLAEELEISSHVIFTGFSLNPMLADAAYDIAVSNSFFEGFPNTIAEYFAVGKPVVTTDAGGTGEMVKDGVNALMIPCGDDAGLYRSLMQLIKNEALRVKLCKNAMETIQQGFSGDIMLENLERLFEKMIVQN